MPRPPEPARLRTSAPAKINWTLEVLGRRSDGYHEIRSVMQTVSLADSLVLQPGPAGALVVVGVGAETLGAADNLVSRAAQALRQRCEGTLAAFHLIKRIPPAAGLGGGSSDAAAALRLLQRCWQLDASTGMGTVAAALGSDVPFFLRGGTQLAEGRGDLLTPLPDGDPVFLILATPPITLPDKTARLYARLEPVYYSDGTASERLVARLGAGLPPRLEDYINVFDQVADGAFPDLAQYRRTFERITGLRPCLAGAGPSLFGVCGPSVDERAAAAFVAALEREGFRAWVVHTTDAEAATAVESIPPRTEFAP